MRADVIKIVSNCPECLKLNTKNSSKIKYPLLVGEAFERVGIDLIEPLSTSSHGNKYIVVAVDYLTKFTVLKAIPEKNITRNS